MENMNEHHLCGIFAYLREDLKEQSKDMFPWEFLECLKTGIESGKYTKTFPNIIDSETGEVVAIYKVRTMAHYYKNKSRMGGVVRGRVAKVK